MLSICSYFSVYTLFMTTIDPFFMVVAILHKGKRERCDNGSSGTLASYYLKYFSGLYISIFFLFLQIFFFQFLNHFFRFFWLNLLQYRIQLLFQPLLSLDCGEPTYSRKDSPPTCHISCKNSDCQFSIVSLNVWLK